MAKHGSNGNGGGSNKKYGGGGDDKKKKWSKGPGKGSAQPDKKDNKSKQKPAKPEKKIAPKAIEKKPLPETGAANKIASEGKNKQPTYKTLPLGKLMMAVTFGDRHSAHVRINMKEWPALVALVESELR